MVTALCRAVLVGSLTVATVACSDDDDEPDIENPEIDDEIEDEVDDDIHDEVDENL